MSSEPSSDSAPWLQFYTKSTPAHIDYGSTTLVDQFLHAIDEYADRPAMWFLGASTTYRQFGKAVSQAAAMLASKGVKAGDRVAVALPNCPQNMITFYAILSLGATAVYHNPLYTARELEVPFRDHGARVGIFWDSSQDVAKELVARTPLETVLTVNMTRAMPTLPRLALSLPLPQVQRAKEKLTGGRTRFEDWDATVSRCTPEDGNRLIDHARGSITKNTPALVLYTSGTTGTPKGAPLTHGNLIANVLQGLAWVPGLGADEQPERMLAALPMFHAYGMTMNVTLAPRIGGEVLLLPAPDVALLRNVIKKKRPTWVPGVPALYQQILKLAEPQDLPAQGTQRTSLRGARAWWRRIVQRKAVDLSGIRNAFSGASSLPPKMVQEWEESTGGRLVEGYGLTETSPIVLGNPMNEHCRPGYVGIPFPDTEAKVASKEDPTVEMPAGEEGELLVRGPQVFHGYLNQEEATQAALVDGWFRTGDMAVMESDGFVKIVSRIKELIVTGGFNVHPGEVEDVLGEHSSVREVAVVGLAKEDGSERVVAVAVLDEGVGDTASAAPERMSPEKSQQLRAHCKASLTGYKVPREFYQIDKLPKDQMGKIRRTEVRQILTNHLAH